MDLLSLLFFAAVVITLVGLAARLMIWQEVRPPGIRAPARRADHTRTDSSTECGGRVVYRPRRLNKWDYIRTP